MGTIITIIHFLEYTGFLDVVLPFLLILAFFAIMGLFTILRGNQRRGIIFIGFSWIISFFIISTTRIMFTVSKALAKIILPLIFILMSAYLTFKSVKERKIQEKSFFKYYLALTIIFWIFSLFIILYPLLYM